MFGSRLLLLQTAPWNLVVSSVDKRGLLLRMVLVCVTGAIFLLLYRFYLSVPAVLNQTTLNVLSYSTFLNSWGPGREIALAFERETGIAVEYRDAGDAGLILRKLDLFPSDVVIGLDQLTLAEARASRKWRPLPEDGERHEAEFLAFDYSPMTFVYRNGDVEPPANLEDLTNARFANSIALQDPRSSTPGQQFLFWILDTKGIDDGFKYLERLKANVKTVTPNWSSAYGLFTRRQVQMVYSYLTSPLYHAVNEQDRGYTAIVFEEPLPLQTEYVGIPSTCAECDAGEKFARFLLRPETQKLIMTKNYMLPVKADVRRGTPFEGVPDAKEHRWKNLPELLRRRDEIFERWRKLGIG